MIYGIENCTIADLKSYKKTLIDKHFFLPDDGLIMLLDHLIEKMKEGELEKQSDEFCVDEELNLLISFASTPDSDIPEFGTLSIDKDVTKMMLSISPAYNFDPAERKHYP